MSIARLASEAVQSNRAQRPQAFAAADPDPAPDPVEDKDDKGPLTSLTRYIPTEIITFYVAVLAAKPALKTWVEGWAGKGHLPAYWIYWGCVLLTPCFFALIYVSAKYQRNEKPPALKAWPWWPILASTLAFMVWGLSVPTNPIMGISGSSLAGVLALFLSMIFTRIDPIFDPSARNK